MGAIMVLGIALILIPAALGMQLFLFLYTYAIPVSIVFWGALLLLSYFIGKGEREKSERYAMYCFPTTLLPAYLLLMSSLEGLVSTTGFDILLLPIMVFMCMSFALLIGIGIWAICTKIKDVIVVPLTIVAEILASCWLVSIGM